jgi:Amt family ammonium transporter
MIVPGLALFYGGLVRAKNMLSILMQCTMIGAMVMVIWVVYGYLGRLRRRHPRPSGGGWARSSSRGSRPNRRWPHSPKGVVLPEIPVHHLPDDVRGDHAALFIGAFAERMKFSARDGLRRAVGGRSLLPVAHMVWDASGLIYNLGAIDFAGGTVSISTPGSPHWWRRS